ncbi:MAG: MBL fold metallo-hydrolase [Promethearchaeota archaeon]
MVKMKFYGHSAFRLTGEKSIVLDPGIVKGKALVPYEEKTDAVCITHRHKDHFGNAVQIAEKHKAYIVGNEQTIAVAYKKGVTAKSLKYLRDSRTLVFDGVSITGYSLRHGFPLMRFIVKVMGFVISMGGVSLAHLGDTVWCENLRRINADILLIPIGGIVTFNIREAAEAVKIIRPKLVVPIHAETSISTTDFRLFEQMIREKTQGIYVKAMKIGETVDLGDIIRKKW